MRLLYGVLFMIPFLVGAVEEFFYPNYVYSHTRISPDWINLFFTTVLVLLIGVRNNLFTKSSLARNVIAFSILVLLIPGTIHTGSIVAGRVAKVAFYRDMLAEIEWKSVYGDKLKFARFINENVLENSRLLIPPSENPWHHTGDTYLMTAFLYPRTAKSYTYFDIRGQKALKKDLNQVDAIVISSEEDGAPLHVWPDFPVPAERIIIFDWQTGEPVVYEDRDYQPSEWVDKKPWGLIFPKR